MLPVRARIWLVSIAAVAALVVVSTIEGLLPGTFTLSALVVAGALLIVLTVIEYAEVSLSVGSGTLAFTVSGPVILAAAMHLGVFPGALIVFLGLTIDGVLRRRAMMKTATNISTYVLAVTLSGIIYIELANLDVSPISSVQNALAASLAGLVFVEMGSWTIAWIVSPVVGMSPTAIWRSNFNASAIEFASLPTLGGLIVVLAEENAIAVLLVLLPLLAPQVAYKTLQRAQRSIRDTIESLADAIDRRDRYTTNHSSRVAGYARAILAEIPEIPDQLAQTILSAARVHDVGKVGVRDAALLRAGPLTAEERQDLQMHTVIGADIVSRINEYRLCASIIRHHHERWDGSGYPDGLAGEDIPIGARIIGVADAFDAMTSDRPYRRAMSAEAAIAEVQRNAGSQFDPKVVVAFEHVMGIKPRRQLQPAAVVSDDVAPAGQPLVN